MKHLLVQAGLIILVSGVVGCSDSNDNNSPQPTAQIKSFSSFTRDVFASDVNGEPLSIVEGVDFQFEAADELETYDDIIASARQ